LDRLPQANLTLALLDHDKDSLKVLLR